MIVYLSYRVGKPHHSGRPSWEIIRNLVSLGHGILMFEGIPPYTSYTEPFDNVCSYRGRQISIRDVSRISGQVKKDLKEEILSKISEYFFNMKIKPNLVIVDNFSELSLAIELSERYNIPIFFRWYGIWNFPEKLCISNYLSFKLKPWMALISLIRLNIMRKMLILERPKKVVITEDGAATLKFREQLLKYIKNSPDLNRTIVLVKNSLPTEEILNFCWPKQHINIVYISRLVKLKKPCTVIWTLFWLKKKYPALFKKMYFHIVGNGSEMSRMRRLAEKLGVTPHITFHGYIKNVDLKDQLKDVCFSLALAVNSHNPIVEALFSGIPVVANDFGEVKRVFEPLVDIGALHLVDTRSVNFSEKTVGKAYAFTIANALNYLEDTERDFPSIIHKKLCTIFPTVEVKVQQEVGLILELIN